MFLLLCLLITGTYSGILYVKASQALREISAPAETPPAAAVYNPLPAQEKKEEKPLVLLLMGIDYRPETRSLNTDVIMALALNPKTRSATLVSLPRDLEMNPEGLGPHKANYFYPYFYNRDRETAFAQIKELFGNYLQVPIDYAMTVDFRGFQQIIDELGGITVNVDMDMRYVDEEDGTNIDLHKGIQKLNGKQTLDFVRYRKSNRNTAESSDLDRNRRQQQVLDQILGKLQSLGGISKLGTILDTLGNNMKTDLPASQIVDLLKTYYGMDRANVQYLPVTGEWVSPYIHVTDEELNAVRQALQDRLMGETPEIPEKPETPVSPGG